MSHLPRSPAMFTTETGNSTTIAAAVTPSPVSEGKQANTNSTDSRSIIEEGDNEWRKHGQLFRANIVSSDESDSSNIFSLSDSCTIERYYRVADRVLEQFLSSNVTERTALIECYLIGTRLFKFLGTVLPTHPQYFSSEPRLEALRNNSESQLMTLLEYIEEMELMIDEMEYSRYILNDLTPLKLELDERGRGTFTIKRPQDDYVTDGNFVQSRSNYKGMYDSDKSKMQAVRIQEQPLQQQQRKQPQTDPFPLNQYDETNIQGVEGGVKAATEAKETSHQTQRNSSNPQAKVTPIHHQNLKQRVAAVVTATNNAENFTKSRRSVRFSSTRPIQSWTSTLDTEMFNADTFRDKSRKGFQGSAKPDGDFFNQEELFQEKAFERNHSGITKVEIERQRKSKNDEFIYKPSNNNEMSWDADFSQFNVFDSEKSRTDDVVGVKTTNTSIESLSQDPCPRGEKQLARSNTLPKIKKPPASLPRGTGRDHVQVQGARLPSSFEVNPLRMNSHQTQVSSGLSDCSSDIFFSLEDPGPIMEPIKTKIEERLERAKDPRYEFSGEKNTSFTMSQYENSSVLEKNSHRKLKNQFRGCIRFLLD